MQHPHAPPGEALRGGGGPGQGQFQDKVGPAAHRRLRPGVFREQGRLSPLGKAAPQGNDETAVRPETLPQKPQLGFMPLVEGVIFRDDPDGFHVFSPKPVV